MFVGVSFDGGRQARIDVEEENSLEASFWVWREVSLLGDLVDVLLPHAEWGGGDDQGDSVGGVTAGDTHPRYSIFHVYELSRTKDYM